MLRFVARRLLQMIPVLFIIATMTFFMLRLAPGGPFDSEKTVTPEIRKNLEAYYGLNKPLYRQYYDYLANVIKGDLGPSFKYPNRTVNELIGESFPISAELGFWSLLVALAVGLPAGIISSLRPNTAMDYIPNSLAMAGICVPNFVLGPLLVLIFALTLGWARVSGWDEPIDRVLPDLEITPDTYCLIVTRGHSHDQEALFRLVDRGARYVGLIGSKRKIKMIFDNLAAEGVSREALTKVYAPLGIDIGSQTVPEIAVSICAELIAHRNLGHVPGR